MPLSLPSVKKRRVASTSSRVISPKTDAIESAENASYPLFEERELERASRFAAVAALSLAR